MTHRLRPAAVLLVSCLLAACAGAPAASSAASTSAPTLPDEGRAGTAAPAPADTETPTPTLTPTPSPEDRLRAADHALLAGDWTAAQDAYRTALAAGVEPDRAAFGLARALEAAGDPAGARVALDTLRAGNPGGDYRALAALLLGDLASAQKDWGAAEAAYQDFLSLGHELLNDFARERYGDALYADGQFDLAVQVYAAAAVSGGAARARLLEKEADALIAGNLAEPAVGVLDSLLQESISDDARARVQRKAGLALIGLDRAEEGYIRYQAALQYPDSYNAYLCLADLLDAGYSVDEYLRGYIDYAAGQYEAAVQAFSRHLAAAPESPGRGLYFRALAYHRLDQQDSALADLQTAIGLGPTSGVWELALFAAADIRAYALDDFAGASQTLVLLADSAPSNPRAPEALFTAGRMAERGGDLVTAAAVWNRAADAYPGAAETADARHFAGVTLFRLADYGGAENTFGKLTNSAGPEVLARAWFWIYKTRAARGDSAGARQALEQAMNADPTGYYSVRAGDLLIGRAAFAAPAATDFQTDLEADYRVAEQWTLNLFYAATTPEPGTDFFQAVRSDTRLARGKLFWALGWPAEAQAEFDSLRAALVRDPAGSLYLSHELAILGYYPGAIFAARQVLDAAGMTDAETLNAPAYFNHVRFGAYFPELILPAAQERGFDPLFVLALVRQESMFGAGAISTSAARGLMQLMPATAQETAGRLGMGELPLSDLYRPVINVRLGTAYLSFQRELFNGNLFMTLAAYNGGPGNTLEWQALSPNDDDLFVEVVRADESRLYMRRIYELQAIYRTVYGE